MIPIVDSVAGIFKGLTGLASEFIEDKDKRNEFNLLIKQAENQLTIAIITQETVPWVDALVKLMYASLSFARPVGGFAMTAFAGYLALKQIPVPKELLILFGSAGPAWGLSRHISKKNGGR
jgi:hypothetical protein